MFSDSFKGIIALTPAIILSVILWVGIVWIVRWVLT